jgi:hypothetical protein
MRLAEVETRTPALPAGQNAYGFIADAVARMRWPERDAQAAALISPPPVLGVHATEPPSGADLVRMCGLAGENRAAVEMVDRALACPRLVAPPAAGALAGPGGPTSVACRDHDLALVCCLDARCLSLRGRWGEALGAIDRLFRLGSLLVHAWQDFGSPPVGMLAKQYACLVAIEMVADPHVDRAVARRALCLANGNGVPADTFLDAWVAPFLRAVARFLDGLGERTGAVALVRRLLADGAVRRAITSCTGAAEFAEEHLAARERGVPPPQRVLYPAVAGGQEQAVGGDALLAGARAAAHGCALPFDKGTTLAALDEALSAVQERRSGGLLAPRECLEPAVGLARCGYRLTALLRDAAAAWAPESWAAPEGLSLGEDGDAASPGLWMPPNAVGAALAEDVICAYSSEASSALGFWQLSAQVQDVYLAALAVAVHARCHGAPPPSLEALKAAGYLADVPRDAYLGRVVNYDRERLRLFLDAEVSAAACCGEPPTAGWEASWYVHLSGGEGRANGGGG